MTIHGRNLSTALASLLVALVASGAVLGASPVTIDASAAAKSKSKTRTKTKSKSGEYSGDGRKL